MASVPETRYGQSGDVHIAYQVVGAGERDLVLVLGYPNHLDMQWEEGGGSHQMGSFLRGVTGR